MRCFRQQSGFTLVEVVVVLAITSMLVAGFIMSQGGITRSTGFTSSLDQLKNQISNVQAEAASAVQDRSQRVIPPNNVGGSSAYVVFGKMVEFTPGSNKMDVYTLIGNDANPQSSSLAKCSFTQVVLKNGLIFTGTQKQAMIFGRQPNQIYTAPLSPVHYDATATTGISGLTPIGAAGCVGDTMPTRRNPLPQDMARQLAQLVSDPVSGLLGLVPRAEAVGVYNKYVLDPRNYNVETGSQYMGYQKFDFAYGDGRNKGFIEIDPPSNSFNRVVP